MTVEVFSMPAEVISTGQHRAEQLARYGRRHDAEDLEAIHPRAFQRMLNRARDDWHASQTKAIALKLTTGGEGLDVEAVAISNKWGPRL